jgi:hypothetical protein
VQLNLHVNAQLLHQRYAEQVKRIEEESEPSTAIDLQSGGRNPAKIAAPGALCISGT